MFPPHPREFDAREALGPLTRGEEVGDMTGGQDAGTFQFGGCKRANFRSQELTFRHRLALVHTDQ
jgi:hypothetical protein